MEEMAATSSGEAGGTALDRSWVAQESTTKMKVMVAIDDSDNSFYALKWVLDKFLKQEPLPELLLHDDQEGHESEVVVSLVHVMEPFPQYAFPGGYVVESATRAQEQNAARILSRASEMCKEKAIKAKTLILEGDPKQMVCHAAEQMHYDLLLVGSRGLGQIKRAFLGSVSDYCSHHARCPVLIVKPPEESS